MISRLLPIALLLGATVSLYATTSEQIQDAPATESCSGYPCVAEYVVFPAASWTVSAITRDGQGRGPQGEMGECTPCSDCKCVVSWAYEDPGWLHDNSWVVIWDNGTNFGTGDANGSIRKPDLSCDGLSFNDTFSSLDLDGPLGTSFSGSFLCPCIP